MIFTSSQNGYIQEQSLIMNKNLVLKTTGRINLRAENIKILCEETNETKQISKEFSYYRIYHHVK